MIDTAWAGAPLPLPDRRSGKIRDSYALEGGRRLMVTTDRLSAFDRVLGLVPHKGQVLNTLSSWWFERTRDIVPNHFLQQVDPRAMIVRSARPFALEVIVRGYITGVTDTSLWNLYSQGIRHGLPEGMRKNQRLPHPLITPTTKAKAGGHDERIDAEEVVPRGLATAEQWETIRKAALGLFARGGELAAERGLILVDTKYEFGLDDDGNVMLIDEVHTPDSSRFWEADTYEARLAAGKEPVSRDKEFVRLAFAAQGYRGHGEPPEMPSELWQRASDLYVGLYEQLTGTKLRPESGDPLQRLEAL